MRISDEIKMAIKTTPPETLAARGIIQRAKNQKSFICLECGNGGGDHGTGFTFILQDGIWKHNCPRCQKFGGDNINLLATYYGLDSARNFNEICRRACADLGISADFEPVAGRITTTRKITAPPPKPTPSAAELEFERKLLEMIRTDIERARANLHNIPAEYLRGLTMKTLKKFGCGYLEDWRHPLVILRGKNPPPTPRLIVPTSERHYNAVLPKKYREKFGKQYWKMHAGSKEIFALDTITAATEWIYIYEGEIDAMSVWQAYQHEKFLQYTFEVFGALSAENVDTGKPKSKIQLPEIAFIATLGAGGNKFVNQLDAYCKELKIKPLFVIMYDDDDTGREFSKDRVADFKRLGYRASAKFLHGGQSK